MCWSLKGRQKRGPFSLVSDIKRYRTHFSKCHMTKCHVILGSSADKLQKERPLCLVPQQSQYRIPSRKRDTVNRWAVKTTERKQLQPSELGFKNQVCVIQLKLT